MTTVKNILMAVTLLIPTSALGSSINVLNASFESNFDNWSTSGGASGTENLNGSGLTPVASDGVANAWLNGAAVVKQDLNSITSPGSTIVGSQTYTLTVDVGDLNVFPPGPFSIWLYDVATGNPLANANGTASLTATPPSAGVYTPFSVTYTSQAAGDPSLGDQTGIGLTCVIGTVQTLMDNVRLTTNPVETPEPSSLALAGLGVLGLGLFARQRRQRAGAA